MIKTSRQLQDKMRNITHNSDISQALYRTYFMERFFERLSLSKYRDNFIIKGGSLVSALIGNNLRTTSDIDTTVDSLTLTEKDMKKIVKEILSQKVDDGVTFKIADCQKIMDDFEYSGIRIKFYANLEKTKFDFHLDISTNDVITPRPVHSNFNLMFENRSISLYTYNLETLLAEKLQTVMSRDVLNTRMKDFYDIHIILKLREADINSSILQEAFSATSQKRNLIIDIEQFYQVISRIKTSDTMNKNWENFTRKNFYAKDISFYETLESVSKLCEMAIPKRNIQQKSFAQNLNSFSNGIRSENNVKSRKRQNPPQNPQQDKKR